MAQTTASANGAVSTISIKIASGLYVDISGATQSIDAATVAVVTGESYTLDGNNALVYPGKFEPVEVVVNILYTETLTTEPFMLIQAAFTAKSAVQIKYLPKGAAASANSIETLAGGFISSYDLPEIDASSGDPLMVTFTLMCPGITYTDVA